MSGTTEVKCIYYLDSVNGFAGGVGTLYRTTNAGDSWTSTGSSPYVESLSFINANTGWLAGLSTVQKTTNGGASWGTQFNSNTILFIASVKAFNANDVIFTGFRGALYKSTNGGANWQPKMTDKINTLSVNHNINSIKFLNAYTGWAATSLAKVVKTTDRGMTWNEQVTALSPTSDALWRINIIDENNVYMTGNGGKVLKTTNGGTNWSVINTGTTYSLLGSYFFNANTGFVAGGSGMFLKTTNGGLNWSYVFSSTTENITCITFTDANTGYYAGSNAVFAKTTNAGLSWNVLSNTGSTEYIFDIQYVNNTGWVVCSNGVIRKTTNGGSSWFGQSSGNTNSFRSISMLNENTGYVTREEGYMLKTTNGGNNWLSVFTGAVTPYITCHFINENIGWVGGYNGTIISIGSTITSIGINNEILPNSFMLSQNYPNPFNPTTNISYSISSPGVVSIKIYNMLGKEINEIVNEFNAAGNYSIKFDGSDLPSGLYFYKMSVNNFTETRKMILIK
ncbi:MAG: YCF48-related protein [Ignavibacteriae bacterium]|nr:YCF48-related protein [Ignavibacteriota bacterium]